MPGIEANVRKNFRFILEIAGVDQYFIQEADLPDFELTEQMHGGLVNDPDVKTPGKPKVGDFIVRKVKPVLLPDNFAWTWLEEARNGTPRQGYARNAILKEVDETGVRTIARWDLIGLWPKKIPGLKFKRSGDGENLIEEVIFSCTNMKKQPEIGA